jgi:hypothetical protein
MSAVASTGLDAAAPALDGWAIAVPDTTRWSRLIPVAIVVYIISFMDRRNIGFAFAGMGHDLGIDKPSRAWPVGSSSPPDIWPSDEREKVDHDRGHGSGAC